MQSDIAERRYFRNKQGTRSHLAAQGEAGAGFQYTLMLTANFMDWMVMSLYGFDSDTNNVGLYESTEARIGSTAIADVARFMIGSLLIPF